MKKLGNVYILGDSLSTFKGYIPETHAACYKPIKQENNDITDVNETWWKIVLNNTDSNLVLNDSWSGTTICHTGYDGKDYSNRSFVTRFDKLIEEKYFNGKQIDTILIFGGTNDNWAQSPVGEVKFEDWTNDDLYKVLPAFCYLLSKVKATLPNARVINILNVDFRQPLTDGMIAASEHYGCEYYKFTTYNRNGGHPGIEGMAQMAEQVLNFI